MSRARIARSMVVAAVVLVISYGAIAQTVFAFRHPWATSTERFLHTWDALRFRRISYGEMRPYEEPAGRAER